VGRGRYCYFSTMTYRPFQAGLASGRPREFFASDELAEPHAERFGSSTGACLGSRSVFVDLVVIKPASIYNDIDLHLRVPVRPGNLQELRCVLRHDECHAERFCSDGCPSKNPRGRSRSRYPALLNSARSRLRQSQRKRACSEIKLYQQN
jgi:hypothetical protein